MMKNVFYVLLLCLLTSCKTNVSKVDLSGEWRFRIDSAGVGVKEEWFNLTFNEQVLLPGSMNTNGKGFDVDVNTPWTGSMWNKAWYESEEYAPYRGDSTKIVFWLQPNKYYVGNAWYQRDIEIPEKWNGQVVKLCLERCHWETELWVDGKNVGMENSLSTPHEYLLEHLTPGKHTLCLRIDNKVREINPGVDAHSISDNTQSNWNGVVGALYLEARPKIFVEQMNITPLPESKELSVCVTIHSSVNDVQEIVLKFNGQSLRDMSHQMSVQPGENKVNLTIPWKEELKLWDEFTPNLYSLEVMLNSKEGEDSLKKQYGVRTIATKGTQITVNGRPIFLRGTLECCIFPKTGFPPTDEAEWERMMKVCREYGLNHIRFHSWCPPEAAFNVADRLGFYLQIECDSWAEVGAGKPIDNYVREESRKIVDTYANHPSFCFLAYGNEPAGPKQMEYLSKFVDDWNSREKRFLVTTAAGWPAYAGNDFHSLPSPRIQHWGAGVKSIINAQHPGTDYDWKNDIAPDKPVVSHEIGQWCVYPDLNERAKYTGVFKAKNYDIFEDRLQASGLLHLADSFLLASGKLQVLCYKADIEAALRTSGFAGFQLLDLHDFPGQGTALVGVLNAFWESKGYTSGTEYSQFCNEVVPLLRTKQLIYNSGDTLKALVQVAQYSKEEMRGNTINWELRDVKSQRVVAKNSINVASLPTGKLSDVGELVVPFSVNAPAQYQLQLSLNGKYTNKWDFWVYPNTKIDEPKQIKVASDFNAETIAYLEKGGKVLFTPAMGAMKNEGKDSVVVGFSSIFWNTLWTNNQAPHTLGILCNPQHPALQLFPTEYHSNYQWRDAMAHCNAIPLHKLGKSIQPIVRIIDDWFTGRSLGLVVELKVGAGKLLFCSADLLSDMENRPEAKQLYVSLLNYMNGNSFNPTASVNSDQIKQLLK